MGRTVGGRQGSVKVQHRRLVRVRVVALWIAQGRGRPQPQLRLGRAGRGAES